MKKCINQKCSCAVLFSDSENLCPFCHSRLVDAYGNSSHGSGGGTGKNHATTTAGFFTAYAASGNKPVKFTEKKNRRMFCTGRIIEIDHHELFYEKNQKLINSLIFGEPYQPAHQTQEWTIRVEEITNGISANVTDFCLYGNYLGRLQVGDSVCIKSTKGRNKRIVKSIRNETTGSKIKPGLQIPAWLVRVPVCLILIMLLLLITGSVLSTVSEIILCFSLLLCGVLLLVAFVMLWIWSKLTRLLDH